MEDEVVKISNDCYITIERLENGDIKGVWLDSIYLNKEEIQKLINHIGNFDSCGKCGWFVLFQEHL